MAVIIFVFVMLPTGCTEWISVSDLQKKNKYYFWSECSLVENFSNYEPFFQVNYPSTICIISFANWYIFGGNIKKCSDAYLVITFMPL